MKRTTAVLAGALAVALSSAGPVRASAPPPKPPETEAQKNPGAEVPTPPPTKEKPPAPPHKHLPRPMPDRPPTPPPT